MSSEYSIDEEEDLKVTYLSKRKKTCLKRAALLEMSKIAKSFVKNITFWRAEMIK
jgi:hypothetical protein